MRWAINQANANASMDVIAFNLPSPYTITPTGAFPNVTEQVTINGGTQPGYSGIPIACIDGGGTLTNGLVIEGIGSVVRGMRISNFTREGLWIYHTSNCVIQACDIVSNGTYGIWVYMSPNNLIGGTDPTNRNIISWNGTGIHLHNLNTTNNTVAGNYIGTTRDGRFAASNGYGVVIMTCSNNIIGGSNTASRNVISANYYGIDLDNNANDNVIIGNYIGVDMTGTNALPNNSSGIAIFGENNRIGGTTAGERNIISGNDSAGIYLRNKDATGNRIIGNYIGTDPAGMHSIPNGTYGIYGSEAPRNYIGGTNAGEGNVISGNANYAIYLTQTAHTYTIRGNYIGVDASGLTVLSNSTANLRIASPSNIIGGGDTASRNIISGTKNQGIWLEDTAHHTIILGNYIGTDVTGSNAIPNGSGVNVNSAHNQIGNSGAGNGNLISGNRNQGINLTDSAVSNSILNNYLGVDASGLIPLPNYVGISVDSAFNEVGNASGGRNIISGNGRTGLTISGDDGHHNTVLDNYIGVGIDGSTPISNAMYGISLFEASSNEIGRAGAGNLISGNDIGMRIFGNLAPCYGNIVIGNYIGTDYTGSNAVPNRTGIQLSGVIDNRIGTRTNGMANLISGNENYGIYITRSTGTLVYANYIGSDLSGGLPLGNGDGVQIDGQSYRNYIGGATNGEGNLICANLDEGIEIRGIDSLENFVWGNRIGLTLNTNDADSVQMMGNGSHGILLNNDASFNWVGGLWTHGLPANVIAHNKGDGVAVVTGCTSNPIMMNSIFENTGLGIDLNNDGVTENDEDDPDVGGNLLQNFVTITVMTNDGLWMYFEGYLNSRPNRTYHLELFSNQKCDASGYGEGEFFMAEIDGLTTDLNGDVGFTNRFGIPTPPPNYVTILATDMGSYDTSEFCKRQLNDTDGDGMGDGYEYIHWGTATSGVATADSDSDGVNNLAEFLADTDPEDATSCLEFLVMEQKDGECEVYINDTSVDRYYDLEYIWNTNLINPSSWSDLIWNKQGVGGTMVVTTETSVATRFYRVQTEAP